MDKNKQNTLGILGIGHLATYTVTGLRHSGDTRRIILSPRNVENAQHLASNFDCEVAQSNQAVIDQADMILLAVRPFQLDDLLADLHFLKHKIVISAVAGVSLTQLNAKAVLPERLALILPAVAAENARVLCRFILIFLKLKRCLILWVRPSPLTMSHSLMRRHQWLA